MSQNTRGAAMQQARLGDRLTQWRLHHQQEVLDSLTRLGRDPVATLVTLLVIAIALALPLGLAKLLTDAQGLVSSWDGQAQISLYLQKDLPLDAQTRLKTRLETRRDVRRVELITPAQALEEFRNNSGYGEAVDLLGENPLPPLLVVYPIDPSPGAVDTLKTALGKQPEVASAELDLAWVQRLAAILELGQRLLLALGAALALAALLVVGNTIRLGIESRREEIRIIKLLGATNAFVRRPFLYLGFWSGFLGGIIALIVVALFVSWLNQPVTELAELYKSSFQLNGLSLSEVFSLLALSSLIGLTGAWLAVARHLRQFEPRA